MKKLMSFFVMFCLYTNSAKAQSADYLQNNQALLLLNPSFAGSNGLLRTQLNLATANRNLYANNQSGYFGADLYIKSMKGAFALTYLGQDYDRGLLRDNTVSLSYAQHMVFGDKRIKVIPSLSVAYMQRRLDVSSLTFGYNGWVNNSFTPKGGPRKNVDFNSGILFVYKTFYGGITFNHLTQPDMGVFGPDPLRFNLNVHAAYSMKVKEKALIQYFALINNQYLQLNVNAIVYNRLIVGCGANSRDVLLFNVGYRHKYWSTVFSYDRHVSKLAYTNIEVYKLGLSYVMHQKDDTNDKRGFENW